MITDDQLRQIMPNLPQAKRDLYLPFLQQAMEEFGITTPLRQAAFLAQIAHESLQLKFMEEIWGPTSAQRRYEPPSDLARKLGNTQAGDGRRFKGRGPIQITGRDNYKRYGDLLGIDILNNPESAATPEVAFRIACLYWKNRGLNELADLQDFREITRRINGGFNGLEDRTKYYDRAKGVLGAVAVMRAGARLGGAVPDDESFTRGYEAISEDSPGAADDGTRGGARKGSAKKGSAKKGGSKGASKKGGAKKGAAKKSAGKKNAGGGAKKSATKKSGAKKSAKGGSKKGGSKKNASKKGGGKKGGSKKGGAKKSSSKR